MTLLVIAFVLVSFGSPRLVFTVFGLENYGVYRPETPVNTFLAFLEV